MLKQEYADRKARRPAYSERAFARDLKVSAGYISLLFRRRRSLSPTKGIEIARRLGWPDEKTKLFVSMIQGEALEASERARARARGESGEGNGTGTRDNDAAHSRPGVRFAELEMDKFRFIADLHHLAALALVQSRSGLNPEEIARRLDLPLVETELIVGRLARLGLVEWLEGGLRSANGSLEIKEIPSEAIRAFHRQAIQMAEAAIEGQPVEMRNLAGLTLSMDPARMGEAKVAINRFLKSFEKKFGNAQNGEVYQICSQLFALTRGDK